MLCRHHGALSAGSLRYNRRSLVVASTDVMMASFRGTIDLAGDAWRAMLARRQRSTTSVESNPSNLHPWRQQVWSPNHGIVFGSSTKPITSATSAPAPPFTSSVATPRSITTVSHSRSNAIESDVQVSSMSATAVTAESAAPTDPGSKESSGPAVETDVDSNTSPKSEIIFPQTTLRYKMSDEIFRAAIATEKGEPGSYWSHTMFVGPEQRGITVHYCRSKHTTERICRMFLDAKVLGFDIEWRADALKHQGPRANVSVIQLASEDRVALFHIALFGSNKVEDLVAPSLKKIMEDPNIKKCGVAIKADATRLRNFLQIDAQGLLELSHLHKLVKYSATGQFKNINKRLVSLTTLVEEHMHLPLFKGGEVRSSDWTQPLNMDQILYAASDTYAGLVLYDVLDVKRQKLDPVPPVPYNAELSKPIRLAEGIVVVDDIEEPEPIGALPQGGSGPASSLPDERLREAQAQISVEADQESEGATSLVAPTKKATKLSGPLVQAAAQWATEYRANHPKTRAMPSQLKAYALWTQNSAMAAEEIAALLRDPPLLTATVQNYILAAITFENLEYDKSRIQDWPPDLLHNRRYSAIWARERKKEEREAAGK